MLMSFESVTEAIGKGNWLHIAGSADLLKKLPCGNWIGGSTEYFMDIQGGVVTDQALFVQEIPYPVCKVAEYRAADISNITAEAYENGFSLLILPFDSGVHREYAKHAADFEDIFLKNIIGWVSGVNLASEGQLPIAVNGLTGEAYHDRAVALHVELPEDKIAAIGIVNIFTPDEASPVIEFTEDSFSVQKCLVNGHETVFADYIANKKIDTTLPLVGEYSGTGINVSFKSISDGTVNFYAPVFRGIKYRIANPILDYAEEFRRHMDELLDNEDSIFSCNCILNFLYGGFEGRQVHGFHGPVTFGEIAYQLVNQTLVYLSII